MGTLPFAKHVLREVCHVRVERIYVKHLLVVPLLCLIVPAITAVHPGHIPAFLGSLFTVSCWLDLLLSECYAPNINVCTVSIATTAARYDCW
jgi:hypothetical protein